MSWNLGSISGIAIKIHWTFLLLLIFVTGVEVSQGSGISEILFTLGFVLSIFLCVLLHEFGHALTGKRYGVTTDQIILLPIGGMANMQKIPENPKQELIIAVAGPLVNVVIAGLIALFLPLKDIAERGERVLLETPSAENFFLLLFAINVVLVVFNAIPAFPMDGGRVLRALLAMQMSRVKATKIAARVGQFFSLVFIGFGLFYNLWLVLIGIFVFLGATGEYKVVKEGQQG